MNLSALSGIRAADLQFATAADNTANLDTPDYHAEQARLSADTTGGVRADVTRADDTGVDLAEQVGVQISAQTLYDANARMISVQRDMERSLFDALG